MSRLSGFATTMGTLAVLIAFQGSVSAADVPDSVSADDTGVVRIVNHLKSDLPTPGLISQTEEAKPIQSISSVQAIPVAKHRNSHPNRLGPIQQAPTAYGYPQLNAPLYPSPQPLTPTYVGGTVITNQAFAPHEMLYPHQYKALYGPYFYQVRGGWYLTPKGVRSHDTWKLQGTEVSVKYRSHYRPFTFPLLTR